MMQYVINTASLGNYKNIIVSKDGGYYSLNGNKISIQTDVTYIVPIDDIFQLLLSDILRIPHLSDITASVSYNDHYALCVIFDQYHISVYKNKIFVSIEMIEDDGINVRYNNIFTVGIEDYDFETFAGIIV